MKKHLILPLLGLVVGVLLSTLLNIVVSLPALKDEMVGQPYPAGEIVDPLDFGHGLEASETLPDGTTFRGSSGHATLTFPHAAQQGRHIKVRLRLAAIDASPPADVTLIVNGARITGFTVAEGFREYEATVDTGQLPNPYLDPSHVQVDLLTNSEAGIAVDSMELEPERSCTQIATEGLMWGLLLAAVLFVAMTRLGVVWAAAFGTGTLGTFALLHLTYMPRGISPSVEIGLAGLAWLLAAWLAPGERPAWGFGLAACCLWVAAAGRILGEWQMDDAYISYRYAWNLVQGNGLVYNPGEVVEGYTNFLWTLFASASLALGQHPAEPALAANIGLSEGLVALTWLVSARLSGGRYPWPLLAAGLLSIDSALLSYGARGSGMEAVLFGFLLLLSVALLWPPVGKEPEWALRSLGGLVLALATLTRPEGLLAAVIILGVRGLQDRAAARNAGKLLLAGLGPYLLVLVPYEVWRITFYRYPFPNTFYAKTGATSDLIGRGLSHISYFIGDDWLIVALAAVGLGLALVRKPRIGPFTALALLVAAYTLYIIWVGGDHFPGWRFFVPVLAPMVLLAVEAARVLLLRVSFCSPVGRAATVVALLVMAFYVRESLRREEPGEWLAGRTKLHNTYVNRWGAAGLWLRENTPPAAWTAAKGAGAIAYYSQRPVVDVYGLNDLHIGHLSVAAMGTGNPGHDKQDPAYVLFDRKPDYILDEWLSYFDPVREQLEAGYEYEEGRSAVGPKVAWWRRNGSTGGGRP